MPVVTPNAVLAEVTPVRYFRVVRAGVRRLAAAFARRAAPTRPRQEVCSGGGRRPGSCRWCILNRVRWCAAGEAGVGVRQVVGSRAAEVALPRFAPVLHREVYGATRGCAAPARRPAARLYETLCLRHGDIHRRRCFVMPLVCCLFCHAMLYTWRYARASSPELRATKCKIARQRAAAPLR